MFQSGNLSRTWCIESSLPILILFCFTSQENCRIPSCLIPLQKHQLLKWCCCLKQVLVLQSWDWVHNDFQREALVKFLRCLPLPVLSVQGYVSAGRCTKCTQISLLKMEQILQKSLPKSVRETRNRLKDLLWWNWAPVFAQMLCKMDVAREMQDFYTHWFSGLTGCQALLVGEWLCLWNDLPSNEGERHSEGDSPSQGGGWERPGASCETLVVFQAHFCPCRYIWSCFLGTCFAVWPNDKSLANVCSMWVLLLSL